MANKAIGMIETKGFVALFSGCDAALKAADVSMTGWESVGSGMVTAIFEGDVASVKAGIEAAAEAAKTIGEVVSVEVIARPHEDLGKMGSFLPS
ncbi:MAG: BMC domain-containing protein [Puniceicoccales bacterium]|uniref:BMC domain-containing protein n=1 Tax=Puniceicoccus vermicola TaxID=388746 RepID=A0A7X1B0U1_9BACT|nr:BMC domain-containing protein [Puniceicoccus vermicola]MBC2603535.1 BMC domain-containing protein [Puniceicoccus vermicola]